MTQAQGSLAIEAPDNPFSDPNKSTESAATANYLISIASVCSEINVNLPNNLLKTIFAKLAALLQTCTEINTEKNPKQSTRN